MWAEGADSVSVPCRVEIEDEELGEFWVGVFAESEGMNVESENWTKFESKEFALELPATEQLKLVALRKDSLPIVKRWTQADHEGPITFEFERGSAIRGRVVSTDGFPVAGSHLSLASVTGLTVPIPDHVSFAWESDEEGVYRIAGLVEGEHEIAGASISRISPGDLSHRYKS